VKLDRSGSGLETMTIKIRPVFLGETHRRVVAALATVLAFQGLDTKETDKYFSVFEFEFLPPPLTHNVNLNTFRATFESLKAL
jgi:hypothetical protein